MGKGILKRVLGPPYGGPSISYDEEREEYVLYDWGDAPVCTEILVADENWHEFMRKLKIYSTKKRR